MKTVINFKTLAVVHKSTAASENLSIIIMLMIAVIIILIIATLFGGKK